MMYRKFTSAILVLLLAISSGYAQDSLLSKITNFQIVQDSFYDAGLFPSQITGLRKKKLVEDNNIFFTALINYTLQSVKETLSAEEQARVDSVLIRSSKVFDNYKNRNGDITYNFYQVRPHDIPQPNLKFFSKREKSKLPDDLDDTSLLFMLQPTTDSLNALLKAKMAEESLDGKRVKSTFRKFRNSKAYRTWFADKMKQDLDICVMSNVLLFVFEKGLALDSIDHETISIIKQMVDDNLHIDKPHLVSAYYQNTAIILYHLARTVAAADPVLSELKPKLINDINNQLNKDINEFERVILLTSLHRLGQKTDFQLSIEDLKSDMEHFFWFKGNPFFGSKLWVKRWVGQSNFLHFLYKSEAYYWALLFELKQLSGAQIILADDNSLRLKK